MDESSTKVERTRSIPSLDGWRGIAVLLVVCAHLGIAEAAERWCTGHHLGLVGRGFRIDLGDLGVSIFFVISGFLITTLLIRGTERGGQSSLAEFYVRRFFRIFPPYYVYIAVVATLWLAGRVPMVGGLVVSSALYTSNYFPYWHHPQIVQWWLLGHTWSLSLEEQFYLLWPALLVFAGRRRAAITGVALIALAPLSRLLTLAFVPQVAFADQISRMLHTRIDTIMSGCVLALLGTWPTAYRVLVSASTRGVTGPATALLLYATLRASHASFAFRESLGLTLEAVLLAYLLFFTVRNAQHWGGQLLNMRALRHLGVISYSLYLWQQLFDGPVDVLHIRHRYIPLAILLAAELSYLTVERLSFTARDAMLRAWRARLPARVGDGR